MQDNEAITSNLLKIGGIPEKHMSNVYRTPSAVKLQGTINFAKFKGVSRLQFTQPLNCSINL
jgi:hypothetical protein